MLTGILIALLPKCPFCILAYTSSVAVCGGAGMLEHAPVWTSYISIGLAALTMSFIGLRYRGTRTLYGLALAFMGGVMITYAELFSGSLSWYQTGAALLLLGVWVNGSFLFFWRKAVDWIGLSTQQETNLLTRFRSN